MFDEILKKSILFSYRTHKNWTFRSNLKARYSISNKKKKAEPKRNVIHFDNELLMPSSYHLNEKLTMLYQELLILCSGITKGLCWVLAPFKKSQPAQISFGKNSWTSTRTTICLQLQVSDILHLKQRRISTINQVRVRKSSEKTVFPIKSTKDS